MDETCPPPLLSLKTLGWKQFDTANQYRFPRTERICEHGDVESAAGVPPKCK